VSGLLPAEAGWVVFDGDDITGWRADRVTRRGLVRTFQIARGFPRLSVLENLMLYGAHQPGEALWRALARPPAVAAREEDLRARAFDVARRLNLMAVINAAASDLSGGQKKLLELGRALMTDPKLILLDEPIAGVNPTLAGEIASLLRPAREGLVPDHRAPPRRHRAPLPRHRDGEDATRRGASPCGRCARAEALLGRRGGRSRPRPRAAPGRAARP
jgi:ABC-type branched-subunit amino acid transport system ATPase component